MYYWYNIQKLFLYMHIVIIDDEVLLSHAMKKKLDQQWYSVSIAHSLSEYRNTPFWKVDLYLVDITLGDGSGFEIIRSIRKDGKEKNIPILIISGHDDTKRKLVGFDIGADDYLVKPFDPQELIARVRKRIQDKKYHEHIDPILRYRDIAFDRSKRLVYKWNNRVSLSKKEKNILEHFMIRTWELVSKDELADTFWKNDNPFTIIENTITVTICNLRRKLGRDFDLETVRSEWYILR